MTKKEYESLPGIRIPLSGEEMGAKILFFQRIMKCEATHTGGERRQNHISRAITHTRRHYPYYYKGTISDAEHVES